MAVVLVPWAEGVQVGTRFIAVPEARAHPQYVQALIEAQARDTLNSSIFSVGWPDAPHRVLH